MAVLISIEAVGKEGVGICSSNGAGAPRAASRLASFYVSHFRFAERVLNEENPINVEASGRDLA